MSKGFSFAHLIGGKARAEAEDDEDHKATTEGAQDDDATEDQDAEDEAAQGDEDEDAGQDTARAAVLAERHRIAGILAAACPATIAQAAQIATQTDLTVSQAKAILGSAPQAAQGGLGALMAGRTRKPLAPAGDTASGNDLPPELQAAQARLMQQKGR